MYKSWKCIIFIIMIFTKTVTIEGQSIELNGSIQKTSDSICTKGLIAGVDWITVIATSDFTGASSDWGRYVQLEFSGNHKFIYNIPVNVKDCNKKIPDEGCFCEIKNQNVYQVTCKILATTDYSSAKLIARLSSLNRTHKISENRYLPPIYDLQKMILKVNDNVITNNTCEIAMDPVQPTIRACCYNGPSPCYVYVYTKGISQGECEGCFHKAVQFSDQYSVVFRICDIYLDFTCNAIFSKSDSLTSSLFFVVFLTFIYDVTF